MIGKSFKMHEETYKHLFVFIFSLIPSSLQEALPAESKKLWNMRDKADLIVLVDWCSKLSSLNPSNKLFILKSIMIEVTTSNGELY